MSWVSFDQAGLFLLSCVLISFCKIHTKVCQSISIYGIFSDIVLCATGHLQIHLSHCRNHNQHLPQHSVRQSPTMDTQSSGLTKPSTRHPVRDNLIIGSPSECPWSCPPSVSCIFLVNVPGPFIVLLCTRLPYRVIALEWCSLLYSLIFSLGL